jgi:hypothetical protein
MGDVRALDPLLAGLEDDFREAVTDDAFVGAKRPIVVGAPRRIPCNTLVIAGSFATELEMGSITRCLADDLYLRKYHRPSGKTSTSPELGERSSLRNTTKRI